LRARPEAYRAGFHFLAFEILLLKRVVAIMVQRA
jgi:hypothetical protein